MKPRFRHSRAWTVLAALGVVLHFSACLGWRTDDEVRARRDQASVGEVYRPQGRPPALPELTADSPLRDFLLFAMLNNPAIEAAYYDWASAVERITIERSLPDPRVGIQADFVDPFADGVSGAFQREILDRVMSLMPGVMMDFPGPGKLRAAAAVASAESEARYFAFESSVLRTAFGFKDAYYRAHFLEAKLAVVRDTLGLIEELERLARIQHEVGKVTLQDVLRSRIEQEQLKTEIENLEDSRGPLLAQFRASLGVKPGNPAPPLPARLETTPLDLTPDILYDTALARNPRLKAMEAEVRMAEASIRLATRARVPDFSAGLEAELETSPLMLRPSLGMTLPIWRDKIRSQIAAAQAEKRAAEARLSAEEIALAVEFAEKSYVYREATRNATILDDRLLPMAQQSLEVARAGYIGGRVDYLNVIDAERTLLNFRLAEIEARIQRELALAELSLVVLGTAPDRAPVLPGTPPATGKGPS